MDFKLTDEQELIVDSYREYMESENWETYFHECDEAHEYPLRWVRGLCELYGFEPHDLANEGTIVLALPAEQAQDALGILRQFNPSASQIGVVQASDRHKVILNNPWGSRRYLELPQGELLPRIC